MASIAFENELVRIARESDWFMRALDAARVLTLSSWCIGAGAVRTLVWDALHGFAQRSALADVDLAYFDAAAPPQRDRELQARLASSAPEFPWEVTNQAHVHRWFEQHFGHAVAPLGSLVEAVASWPEYASAVGIYATHDGALRVIAPYGLTDLFGMVVRRNPTRVSDATYRLRIAQKAYATRWPKVTVIT